MSFATNLSNKYGKQLLDTATKIGLDAIKTLSKKVVHEAAEATVEFVGNEIAAKIVKPSENPRNIEEIAVPPVKREDVLNELIQVL